MINFLLKSAVNKPLVLLIFCVVFFATSCADLINKITRQDKKEAENDTTIIVKHEEKIPTIDTNVATITPPASAIPDKIATDPNTTLKEDKKILDYCSKMPFSDFNKQIRESINASWVVKQNGSYDKGFRDAAEFEKWNITQLQLFNKTFEKCKELALCDANKNDKDLCKNQHTEFNMWQDLHKTFVEKAGILQLSQPPPLCHFEPNADDLRYCFEQIANRIDKKCSTKNCIETSQCWRSISILDQIVLQSSSSCGFANQTLENCQGYKSALKRKIDRVDECKKLNAKYNISLIPIL